MLILSRKSQESVMVGVPGSFEQLLKVTVLEIRGIYVRLGFEADVLPYVQVEALRRGGLDLVPTSGQVEALRAVKDADEVAAIGRAARAAERAFEALTAETWVGRSERELAWRLRQLMHAHGVDHPSFDIVIATGPNGSKPHAEPGEAIVGDQTFVVADFGAKLDGYCSDCTRTLATGKSVPKELRRAYDVCLEAQLKALEAARSGAEAKQTDAAAREVIEEAGFGQNFGHGLGHGVGIDVHEAPHVASTSTDSLVANNVVTIEPGIYLEGTGGIRIEDLVIITNGEPEVVSSFAKELMTVS